MAWIKDGSYFQYSYRFGDQVRTMYFGRWGGVGAFPRKFRRWLKGGASGERPGAPRGWLRPPTWPKSGSAWGLSRASRQHALRPWGITGRNDIDGGERE